MTVKPNTALILVGHGSTLNPDSSDPTHAHADRIRAMGVFDEVVCCFWKEEPNMREVFSMIDSDIVYVVPVFISEGYFTQEVLPRELGLDGRVNQRQGKTVYYCDPVGVHPNMKRLLLQRADEIAPGVPRDQTSLIIVGHGTSLNENSTKAIKDQVSLIVESGAGFAEVTDAYMEQEPLVSKWSELTTSPHVVVVPFFIADGLHSYQDIPVLLGILEETGEALSQGGSYGENPHQLNDRQLFYSTAIGTESLLAEVILDMVADFDRQHNLATLAIEAGDSDISLHLEQSLASGEMQLGQVWVGRREGGYFLCHIADRELIAEETHSLQLYERPEQARLIARYTDGQAFRPLHSAPTLRAGWCMRLTTLDQVRLALDWFYPAALGLSLQRQLKSLERTTLRDYLERQTGMYHAVKKLSDEEALKMVAETCGSSRCLRRIEWWLNSEQPLAGAAYDKVACDAGFGGPQVAQTVVPLLCVEPCPQLLGEAHKRTKKTKATTH